MTKAKFAVADLRTKFLPLFRRSSTSSAASSTTSSIETSPTSYKTRSRSKVSVVAVTGRTVLAENIQEEEPKKATDRLSELPLATALEQPPSALKPIAGEKQATTVLRSQSPVATTSTATVAAVSKTDDTPVLTFEGATPESQVSAETSEKQQRREVVLQPVQASKLDLLALSQEDDVIEVVTEPGLRKQSLALHSDHRLIRSLLQSHDRQYGSAVVEDSEASSNSVVPVLDRSMVHRKIWVRRPGASPTLVQINEDDLVDDVREMILKKYANSLGRSFDSPDVTLKILSREHSHRHHSGSGGGGGGGPAPNERPLGPEEHMTRTLDAYYPGGQTVDEALIIDVPIRRTPRQSPRVAMPYYPYAEDMRPAETDQGYFPAMPPGVLPSPHLASNVSAAGSTGSGGHHHSISVLNTGVVPPLPSPGSRSNRPGHRPRFGRNNTSSPTASGTGPPHNGKPAHVRHGSASDRDKDNRLHAGTPAVAPLPTPPIPSQVPARTATPPPRPASPRPAKQKRARRNVATPGPLPGSLLDGTVPPINVLIVEDNIINLKLLEAFMKRLKVRWHTAMNGRDAVKKWREGGFHLVLMDIQLPLMNGLDATKEIRRLEKVNGVGVLGTKSNAAKTNGLNGRNGDCDQQEHVQEKDRLSGIDLFKSSVIIVALTASSLQSDRHEALAAGCNDFLTKPVNFVWLERKVSEWGCMQALIDFDGWQKWKEVLPKPTTAAARTTTTTSTAAGRLVGQDDSDKRPSEASNGPSGKSRARSSSSHRDRPDVKIQAPTPPAPAPAKLAASSAGSGEDAAEQEASPTSQGQGTTSGAGSKNSSPTSARSVEAGMKRGKRSSFGRGSGLSGVAEEGEHEEGKSAEANR